MLLHGAIFREVFNAIASEGVFESSPQCSEYWTKTAKTKSEKSIHLISFQSLVILRQTFSEQKHACV